MGMLNPSTVRQASDLHVPYVARYRLRYAPTFSCRDILTTNTLARQYAALRKKSENPGLDIADGSN